MRLSPLSKISGRSNCCPSAGCCLRDLCLKLEDPSLQQIRDACADFARGDDAEEDIDDVSDEDEDGDTFADMMADNGRYAHLHTDDWLVEKLFPGQLKPRKDKTRSSSQKIRVTLCGKSVWNHASEKAMSRDSWLQFSIIAKDCDRKHAIQLCRNWAEFSDLNLLTHWQYFPASNWASGAPDRLIQQLQELEFSPYSIDLDAQQYRRHLQVGSRSKIRRQHDIIVGHMKRGGHVFPESTVADNVTTFLKSDECEGFKNSLLFSSQERSKSQPDRRSWTSYKYRDKKFSDEWNEVAKSPRHFTDIYPLEWSMTVRPTIAKRES